MKIAICEFHQETNSFNPFPSPLEDYLVFGLWEGEELLKNGNGSSALDGMIHVLEENKVQIVPTCRMWANAAGPVEAQVVEDYWKNLSRRLKEALPLERFTKSREDAIAFFKEKNEPYKVELIEDLPEGEEISFYSQGDWVDLCAGPHLMSTKGIKAFKLLSSSGAYWRGDENKHMLTRIYGTAYATKDELKELSQVCRHFKLPLYIDGARLITGLACPENELSLPDIADLCDVFYIGGTKAGTLCGEAVVFTKNNTPAHFLTQIKQHGALLAKGRLCGVQFDALFTDELYKETGRNAIETAALLREGLRKKGYTFYNSSPTNQLFLVMENSRLEELKNHVVYSFWEKADDTHTVIRFATSWATAREDVEKLLSLL